MSQPRSLGEFNIRLRISVTVVLLIGAVALISAYLFLEEYRDEVGFIGSTLAGVGTVYAAYFVAESYYLNVHYKRQSNSAELILYYGSIDWGPTKKLVSDLIVKNRLAAEEVVSTVKADPDLRNAVSTVLNFFEKVSILISVGHADEEILFRDLKSQVVFVFSTFEPFIADLREEFRRDSLFSEFEKLYLSWSGNKYLYSGTATNSSS